MRLLVTGGAGRLGSELSRALSAKGDEVAIFDVPSADFKGVGELHSVKIIKGDVTRKEDLVKAVEDVDAVFHLASLIPPVSERDRATTIRVNVEGTRNLLEALLGVGDSTPIIFTSSVSVYGVTANEEPPIRTNHPFAACDNYSESKIECEHMIRCGNSPYVILRVTGIYDVALMELPRELQFTADQRVEFIDRRCVVKALCSAAESRKAINRTFNVAGGRTWQMSGREFIDRTYSQFGAIIDPHFRKAPGWLDWYDTIEDESMLHYQTVSYERFLKELRSLARKLFA